MNYIAQRRDNENANWVTVKPQAYRTSTDAREAAWDLNDEMQRIGFYVSELHLHRDDLAKGEVLTADNGVQVRVIPAEEAPLYPLNEAATKLALSFDNQLVEMAKEVGNRYRGGEIPWGAYNDLNNALEYFQEALHAVVNKGRAVAYKES